MASSRNKKIVPFRGASLEELISSRIVNLLPLTEDFKNVKVVGSTVEGEWKGVSVIFGLETTLAGVGHDQWLNITVRGKTLRNITPTSLAIGSAVAQLAAQAA